MPLALERNERVSIDGHLWKVERRTPDGHCLVSELNGRVKALSDKKLLKHWTEGRLERQCTPKASATPRDRANVLASPEAHREIALHREAVLAKLKRDFGGPPYSNRQLDAFVKLWRASGEPPKAISLASIRRWLANSRTNGAALPVSRSQPTRLSAEVETIIQKVVDANYMRKVPDSVEDVVKAIERELARHNAPLLAEKSPSSLVLVTPSRATIYRRVQRINDEARITARKGRRAAQLSYGTYQGAPIETIPMGAVEIDHTILDVIVTDEDGIVLGKPTLTVAICRATRMCVGFCLSWEHPGFSPLMHTLRHMITPKPSMKSLFKNGFVKSNWPCHGLPLVVIVDNGAEFHSANFKFACASLGNIHIIYCPPKCPEMKGKVERFIKTINSGIIHRLPGTTFGKVDKTSDYVASKAARCTLHEINLILHKFFVDIYPYRYHRGLKQRPIDAWNSAVQKYPLRLPRHLSDLDILASGYEERTVRNTGIEFLGFFYESPELKDLRIRAKGNPTVQIRYNASDIGTIHVLDEQVDTFIKASCTAQEIHGRSLWQAKCLLKTWRMRKENSDEQGLRNSNEALKDRISANSSKKTNLYKGKSRHARFASKPATPTELVHQEPLSLLNWSSDRASADAPVALQADLSCDIWPSLTDRERADPDPAILRETMRFEPGLYEEGSLEKQPPGSNDTDLDDYASKYDLHNHRGEV